MGFNKRHLYKSLIVKAKNFDDIIKLTKADALFFDGWSLEFFKNFDATNKYDDLRSSILEKSQFLSDGNYKRYPEYENLKKLGNIFVNLRNDPSWLEIQLVTDILNIEIPGKILGIFNPEVEYLINQIDIYFTQQSRSETLQTILK